MSDVITTEPTTVRVWASDPVSRWGVVEQLAARPELEVVEGEEDARAEVAVVASDAVDEPVLGRIRRLRRIGGAQVLVIVPEPDDVALFAAVEAGAVGVLRRADATRDALVEAVRVTASGGGTLSPDLTGRLLQRVGELQRDVLEPRGLSANGLADREIEVLRLAAEGRATAEIAEELSYSERTIKNVVHDVTTRLGLRNRTHAVAYALREGLI